MAHRLTEVDTVVVAAAVAATGEATETRVVPGVNPLGGEPSIDLEPRLSFDLVANPVLMTALGRPHREGVPGEAGGYASGRRCDLLAELNTPSSYQTSTFTTALLTDVFLHFCFLA